ncbi:hypothetical protein BHE74_00038898 [Ensete ventricosum]|nr:hypothetical protein BHE74_00038898 [Ensete ventricosum]
MIAYSVDDHLYVQQRQCLHKPTSICNRGSACTSGVAHKCDVALVTAYTRGDNRLWEGGGCNSTKGIRAF